jgi:catechol 2,3-dioxygenase-like lactoylglutathione lyase family enzyme
MFNHIMVGSNDIERSQRFYDAVLATLGVGAGARNVAKSGQTRVFYRHDGYAFGVTEPINGQPASAANGATIAFRGSSAEQVMAFHAAAVANGGISIEDPPGPRETPAGTAHLAYVRDPDGNKLCVVYRAA